MLKKIFIILGFTLATAPLQAAVVPLSQEEFRFLYDRYERVETQTPKILSYFSAPYNSERFDLNTEPFLYLSDNNYDYLNIFGFIKNRYVKYDDIKDDNFVSLNSGISFSPFENGFIFSSFNLDEEKAEDPDYTGKKWRGLAGEMDNAFLNYNSGNFDITAGRFASFWGIKKSLLLSYHNSLDGLQYSYRYKRLTLSYRFAELDNIINDTTGESENRYFAGHRIDYHFSEKFRLGLFESVIFGGAGRTIGINYLNPLIFFHADQLNDDINDNTFVGFDFTLYPIDNIKLYGQLLVDDFQIEKKTQGDQEPDQFGLIAGIYFVDVLNNLDLRFEYCRVNNWTFNQKENRNRYAYKDRLLGYFNRNDFDNLLLEVSYWSNEKLRFSVTTEYQRNGEGSIFAEWTEPWNEIDGDYDEPFPTGIVEKKLSLTGSVEGFVNNYIYLKLNGGLESIDNLNNQALVDDDFYFINITFSIFSDISL